MPRRRTRTRLSSESKPVAYCQCCKAEIPLAASPRRGRVYKVRYCSEACRKQKRQQRAEARIERELAARELVEFLGPPSLAIQEIPKNRAFEARVDAVRAMLLAGMTDAEIKEHQHGLVVLEEAKRRNQDAQQANETSHRFGDQ